MLLSQERPESSARTAQQQLQQQVQRGQSAAVLIRLTFGTCRVRQPAQRSAISLGPLTCTGRRVTSAGQALEDQ